VVRGKYKDKSIVYEPRKYLKTCSEKKRAEKAEKRYFGVIEVWRREIRTIW